MDTELIIPTSEETTVALWLRFRAGDADAFGKLAQIHYRVLYNYGSRFSSDPDFVRDCVQELYMELWERRTFLSETPFVKSYLLKALRHKLIKESQKLKRFQHPSEVLFDPGEPSDSKEAELIVQETITGNADRLNVILANLTKRQREVIYLRFYQNLQNDDISKIMGLGKPSVANLISKTLKEIKEIWAPAEFLWLLFFGLTS